MLLFKTANTTCRRGKKGKMVKGGVSPALFIVPSILIMNKICTFLLKEGGPILQSCCGCWLTAFSALILFAGKIVINRCCYL